MPLIVWINPMSVGVKLLDNDHRKLVLLINELHNGLMTGRAKPALEKTFEALVRYTRVHFAHEERLFDETGYPNAAAHREEHGKMMKRVRSLQTRFHNSTELAVDLDVMLKLKAWLFNHLEGADLEYVPYLQCSEVVPLLAAWAGTDVLRRQPPTLQAVAPLA